MELDDLPLESVAVISDGPYYLRRMDRSMDCCVLPVARDSEPARAGAAPPKTRCQIAR